MRFLQPATTAILTVHMKPTLADALEAIVGQTRQNDLQVIVVDSGQWLGADNPFASAMRDIYMRYAGHPILEWVFTGEAPGLIHRKCPVAWATNETIRAGLVRGRYVVTTYDDDRWHPTFHARMAGFLDEHPEAGAVWCSQNRIDLHSDGTETLRGVIAATGPKSSMWDNHVDGGQIMFRADALDAIGDPWLDENPADASCRHSDGTFLERLGDVVGTVPAIPDILLDHRFTPISTYTRSVR